MATNYQPMTTATAASTLLASNALLNAVKTLVTANSAWSTVEDVVPTTTTTTARWLVFKCDHTASGLVNDFYVVLLVAGAAPQVQIAVGEAYNSTTHTLSGCCPQPGATATPDSAGRLPTPATLALNASTGVTTTTGTTTPQLFAVTTNATTIFWQAVVYADHFVLGYGTTQAGVVHAYVGGYISLVPSPATNDPFNFALVNANTTGVSAGSTPREPLQVASTNRALFGGVSGAGTTISGNPTLEYARASASASFDPYQGVFAVSRIYLANNGATAGVAAFSTRGVHAGLVAAAALPPGITIGDTVTLAGTSWAFLGGNAFMDTGS